MPPDNVISFEASVEVLARLRDQGKIRHVGLSNVTREHIERAPVLVSRSLLERPHRVLTFRQQSPRAGAPECPVRFLNP
jgi:aryl-alcohol dehydrogenase-like predicted oxidoreductase